METVTTPGDPDIAEEVPTEALDPVAITILFPAVLKTRFPLVAVIAPVVAVIPVPAVTVVPAANVVVVVKEPGAVIAEGSETVAVPEAVETVI